MEWCNAQQKIFRMPWKHAKKTNYDPEKDGKLFKLWAVNTGKYKEGARADPTAWKINFRCALNALRETICEEIDVPLNDDFRVFRFVAQARTPLNNGDSGAGAAMHRECVDVWWGCRLAQKETKREFSST